MLNSEQCDLHLLDRYDYFLPKERIAQFPVSPRDASKLLFVSRAKSVFADHSFRDLPDLLREGDLLVVNNSRVIPARLQSNRGEVLLVKPVGEQCWDALVFPGKRFKPGITMEFEGGVSAEVVSYSQIGRILKFSGDVYELVSRIGKMPLPPYIEREPLPGDRHTYQTIYARKPGSVAAPTAGFHFTRRILQTLSQRGIEVARITLHVGPGTFRPVKSRDITQHSIAPEYYSCSKKTLSLIRRARRVIAVGTTTTRALETIFETGQEEGWTSLFIYPGYRFQAISGLLTNFHLPKSSLLMLVSALGGPELIRRAYEHAVEKDYRFYSYGDAMLIL